MKHENANRVFLLSRDGKPLMPCRPRKARLLLKSGKAFVVKKYPFTIQLKYGSYGYKQKVSLGVDTGQRHIGFAIVSQNKVLHQSEVELRQDVHKNLYTRKIYRRSKRNRKTRYRQARFLNRVHGKRDGLWLPPSIKGKVSHNIAWIKRYLAVLPNPDLHIEVGKFDMAKMVNPEISGKQYQEGSLKDWKNYEYYVLARDEYTCQLCHKHGEGVKPCCPPHCLPLTRRDKPGGQSNNALHGLPYHEEPPARWQALQVDEGKEESDKAAEGCNVHEHSAQADYDCLPRSKLSIRFANLRRS